MKVADMTELWFDTLGSLPREEFSAGAARFSENPSQYAADRFLRDADIVTANHLTAECIVHWLREEGRSTSALLRILDVGSGGGMSSMFLVEALVREGYCNIELWALDFVPAALSVFSDAALIIPPEMAEKYSLSEAFCDYFRRSPCVLGSVFDLRLPKAFFHVVFCVFVQHHLCDIDRELASSEMVRVAKHGALVSITDAHFTYPEYVKAMQSAEDVGRAWVPECFVSMEAHQALCCHGGSLLDFCFAEQRNLYYLFGGVKTRTF